MWRKALNLAAMLALCCSVGMAMLRPRSFRQWDKLIVRWPAHGMGIASARGMIVLNVKLTNDVTELPKAGWSSSRRGAWDFGTGLSIPGNVDPLPIGRRVQFFADRRRFAWETVVGDPPDGSYIAADRTVIFPAPSGPRPVMGDRYFRVRLPHWALSAGLFALSAPRLMLVTWRLLVRRQRIARGTCIRCGYDLQATPERCPECGTAAHSSSQGLL